MEQLGVLAFGCTRSKVQGSSGCVPTPHILGSPDTHLPITPQGLTALEPVCMQDRAFLKHSVSCAGWNRQNITWRNAGFLITSHSCSHSCQPTKCWWWKSGATMGLQGKHSKDTCMGYCGMARRFIQEKAVLCPLSVHPAMEKVQPCPQQGQHKNQCPGFLLHIKA